MDLGLKDKVALVTGAGQGIGRAIVLGFAAEGAHVVINDLMKDRAEKVAEEARELGVRALAGTADVTRQDEVQAAIEKALAEFGRIDILVNNAGATRMGKTFVQSKKDDWDFSIDICLYGVMNFCHATLPQMIERKYGKIVNIISDAGRVGEPMLVEYSAAKAGILGFSKAVCKEVARHGININCVAPGTTKTEMWYDYRRKQSEEASSEEERKKADDWWKKAEAAYPMRRFAEPEEIARVVVFLASDAASFVTGQALSVSGGYFTAG